MILYSRNFCQLYEDKATYKITFEILDACNPPGFSQYLLVPIRAYLHISVWNISLGKVWMGWDGVMEENGENFCLSILHAVPLT